jgi:acyl-CoA synthetase (AMP-forming)/AMP-acid ligase II
MPTGHSFVEAMLGAMLLGAIPVPLATPMTFGSVDRYLKNLTAIVADCGARTLVTYPRIAKALPGNAELTAALTSVLMETDLEGLGPTQFAPPSIGASDVAFLQYTSGTTGRPKGATISHGAVVTNAFAIHHGLSMTPNDVGASWLPVFHDMGLVGVLLTSICHPYPIHVMTPEAFVMHPRRWLELISKVGATLSPAPNFAYDMCVTKASQADVRLDSWRVALNGAEPVHARTVGRFSDQFASRGFGSNVMMPVYGMAENTLAVAFPPLERKFETVPIDRDALEQGGIVRESSAQNAYPAVSVGQPVAGTIVEIIDDDGRIVPEGTVGQITVAGPSLMSGYFRNEEASAQSVVGGALRTGDLGFVHAGRLFVTGRAKEIIIKGGRNLHPYDIERVASDVDGVRAGGVAAFGRENVDTGTEDLVVVAETQHGEGGLRDKIAADVRAELLSVLGIKPEEVRVCAIGSLPRTTSGKIRRRECARIFAPKGTD